MHLLTLNMIAEIAKHMLNKTLFYTLVQKFPYTGKLEILFAGSGSYIAKSSDAGKQTEHRVLLKQAVTCVDTSRPVSALPCCHVCSPATHTANPFVLQGVLQVIKKYKPPKQENIFKMITQLVSSSAGN
jgi:hypothetical protein